MSELSQVKDSRSTLAPDDPRHGTANGYSNRRCRCDECRAAWAAHYKAWTHRTARATPREDYFERRRQQLVHGTEAGSKRGCKCGPCRLAATVARWERRQVGEVRTHNASGYANGCRCEVCREARRIYQNAYRKRLRAAASRRDAS